jgi:hypothetical protein
MFGAAGNAAIKPKRQGRRQSTRQQRSELRKALSGDQLRATGEIHAGAAAILHADFNPKHHKVGYLSERPCKAIACEKDAYLLTLVRYI